MSRHRLRTHENLSANAPLPQLGDVMPLIEREEALGGHWYWLGNFSREREAVMPWRLPSGVLARLAVPRLLHQLQGDCPLRAGLLNECGLVSCVNPSHWHVETVSERGQLAAPVVLTDFHGHGWTPTRTTTCAICFQPANRPCDPVYHDAEFRRRTAAEATTCPICNAGPHEECKPDVHRLVFQHETARLKKHGG